VAMLSMALPVAIVRMMESSKTRERVLCGLAICLLMGAMISTYRKSALLAPLSVCLILAYFRRREMLRLAPLGVVVLIAIPILAPNALGSIVAQFEPNRLGVATVSDRVSDYDAIRPDLLSHMAFGRGYGSYEHTNHRILDNDLLMRVVETGLVGLVAYVLMFVLVIATAAPVIRSRDPSRAPPALAVAAAAGAFLVLSVLFDIMSFPHTPYIAMVLFGLLATIVADREGEGLGLGRWRQSSRITRAGLPAATTPAGIGPVTTDPAPITESEPILVPLRMRTPMPTKTLSPISTGASDGEPPLRRSGWRSWKLLSKIST
jgi:O-antigen ligase